MSVIVRAKITLTTKFRDEKILIQSLEKCNIDFVKSVNSIKISNLDIELIKRGGGYIVEFEGKLQDGRETRETIEKRKKINKIISEIEYQYTKILNERIEILKYKEKMLSEILAEEERKKQEILIRRERERLERIKRKREMEKQKAIEEKVKKLKEKAKMLGYGIEERVEKNERVLVLVRRR